jgi:Fe-S cluster assembly iron-binding protein IscA
MLEVTPQANEQVAAYFEGKEPSPIRIFLTEGG